MTQPRALSELVDTRDPAWPSLETLLLSSRNPVEVLPTDEKARRQVLLDAQVTTRSFMGAVIYHTGGLFIRNGWLRFLGSGHPRFKRSIVHWNQERTRTLEGKDIGFWLFADDVLGGFFALDGGALGTGRGQVCYFAPDNLAWLPMGGMGYSQFLEWSLGPNLDAFYKHMFWSGWENEVGALSGDQGLSVYPPLWTVEGKNIATSSRRPCPIAELYALNVMEIPKHLQSKPE